MDILADYPPGVTVRPFRVSPPDAAAADTSAAISLFRGGMADVAADGEAAGLDPDGQLGASVRRWAETTATTDLADIPASYALRPLTPSVRAAEEEAAGGTLEGGDAVRAPPSLSPQSSSSPRGPPRGYFFLAVDVASGAVLGCVGGKPPKVPVGPPGGAARENSHNTGDGGSDTNGGGGGDGGDGEGDGGRGDDTGAGGGGNADADSGGGVTNGRDNGGTGSGEDGGAQPPQSQLSVELVRMAVASDARRRGIGRALIAALHSAVVSDGVNRVNLTTLSTMVSAMRLYMSAGYRQTFRVPLSQMGSKLDVPSSVVGMEWEGKW